MAESAMAYGLTESGVREAVDELDFSRPLTDGGAAPLPTDRSRQINEVVDAVRYLIETGGASSRDLQAFFDPCNVSAPSQGKFVEHQEQAWFETVIAPRLRDLPFIEEDGSWTFDPSQIDQFENEHLQPLHEIRDDPMIEAEQTLDDLSVPRGSDRREDLLDVYAYLCACGETTSEDLNARVKRSGFDIDDFADELEALGANREVEYPPDPAEIEIETYADVLQAEEDVDRDPVTQWSVK